MRTINEIGETEIIKLLQKYIISKPKLGSNEDAYLINNQIPYILINVDTMSRKSDFLPTQTWSQIGHKLVIMTFSDLVAKGAKPESFLSSLILEKDFLIDDLETLAEAIQKTAADCGALYLGGDLGSADEAVITGVGLGSINDGKIITRRGASVGDVVCVTQYFGLTAAAFDQLLGGEEKKFPPIPSKLLKEAKKRVFQPTLRLKEGLILSKHHLATSAIDSSDGLASALNWLAKESKLNIDLTFLPVYPSLKEHLNSLENVMDATLYGGEEFEIVFTVPQDKLAITQELFQKSGCQCIKIGICCEGKGVNYSGASKSIKIPPHGWDSIRKTSKTSK